MLHGRPHSRHDLLPFRRAGRGPDGFSSACTALHAVAVAVELGDAGLAMDLAHDIEPEQLSAERRARYRIGLAMRRKVGESLRYLQVAEKLTPGQTRPSNGADDSFTVQITVKGAPAARRCSAPQTDP
jgi:hypothetical protein